MEKYNINCKLLFKFLKDKTRHQTIIEVNDIKNIVLLKQNHISDLCVIYIGVGYYMGCVVDKLRFGGIYDSKNNIIYCPDYDLMYYFFNNNNEDSRLCFDISKQISDRFNRYFQKIYNTILIKDKDVLYNKYPITNLGVKHIQSQIYKDFISTPHEQLKKKLTVPFKPSFEFSIQEGYRNQNYISYNDVISFIHNPMLWCKNRLEENQEYFIGNYTRQIQEYEYKTKTMQDILNNLDSFKNLYLMSSMINSIPEDAKSVTVTCLFNYADKSSKRLAFKVDTNILKNNFNNPDSAYIYQGYIPASCRETFVIMKQNSLNLDKMSLSTDLEFNDIEQISFRGKCIWSRN